MKRPVNWFLTFQGMYKPVSAVNLAALPENPSGDKFASVIAVPVVAFVSGPVKNLMFVRLASSATPSLIVKVAI